MTSAHDFSCIPYIKEIGRGKAGARSLSAEQAETLFGAILAGRVSDVELGGVMLALRMKGETSTEMAAFLQAAQPYVQTFVSPPTAYAPVILPSYNGARHTPNLLPLFAAYLAQAGVPVLVHGVRTFAGRVTTYEIWQALGWPVARTAVDCQAGWEKNKPVLMLIDDLAPALARLLHLRTVLGVRNATHTLVKMLQPFSQPALRVISYTHPEYHALHTEVLLHGQAGADAALLLRGAEGEPVAHPKRMPTLEFFHHGQGQMLLAADDRPLAQVPVLPDDRSAVVTAAWIEAALVGEQPIPDTLLTYQACVLRALNAMRA